MTGPHSKKEADTRDGRFYSFAFIDNMPKLNTNNEEVIAYFCKICENWIKEFDIDGIRFDVGNEVSHRVPKASSQPCESDQTGSVSARRNLA